MAAVLCTNVIEFVVGQHFHGQGMRAAAATAEGHSCGHDHAPAVRAHAFGAFTMPQYPPANMLCPTTREAACGWGAVVCITGVVSSMEWHLDDGARLAVVVPPRDVGQITP